MGVKLIFGCGYLGARVAQRWVDAGDRVYAITRSDQRTADLRARGIEPIVADVTTPRSLNLLPVAETVLWAVGYDRTAGVPIEEVYIEGLRHALAALPRDTGRVIYISSTGVYAQDDGSWVDESSECRPRRAGGQACLAAEQLLAADRLGVRTVVLRLAGIYGPGRIPRCDELVAGRPLAAPAEGFLNLIHVEDAVDVVLLAERKVQPPRTYVVSDGRPVERRGYYTELARLLGAGPPTFAPPVTKSPAQVRAGTNKRIRTERLFKELKPRLKYPSYREGLAAILRDTPS